MDLMAWRTFLAVRRCGSLSGAAQELGYTQSAVSRQIQTLEKQLGVALLERQARGVRPTPAGEAFAFHAHGAIEAVDRAVRVARSVRTGPRPVAVGATPSTAAGLLPPALRRARERQPDLTWTLTTALTSELEELVADGNLDLAVVTDAPPGLATRPSLRRQLVTLDPMVVLVPLEHPAAQAQEPLSLAAFAEEAWVEDDDGSAALLRSAATRAGFEPKIEFAAADLAGKTAMVAAGHAVALAPSVLAPALRRDVIGIPVLDAPERAVYISTRAAEEPNVVLVEAIEAQGLSCGSSPTAGHPVGGLDAPGGTHGEHRYEGPHRARPDRHRAPPRYGADPQDRP